MQLQELGYLSIILHRSATTQGVLWSKDRMFCITHRGADASIILSCVRQRRYSLTPCLPVSSAYRKSCLWTIIEFSIRFSSSHVFPHNSVICRTCWRTIFLSKKDASFCFKRTFSLRCSCIEENSRASRVFAHNACVYLLLFVYTFYQAPTFLHSQLFCVRGVVAQVLSVRKTRLFAVFDWWRRDLEQLLT